MELNKYDRKYKEFIKAKERLDVVEEKLRELPLRPLQTPFQRGWEVSIRLRDDITRRSDAELIYKLLDMGYSKSYITQSLKDVKAIRKGETEVPYVDWRGRKSMRTLLPNKKWIDEKQYNELPEHLKKYFDFDRLSVSYTRWGKKHYQLYLTPYWLKLKARPYIVTHQCIKGGELERERDELRSFLEEYWREWCDSGRRWMPKWKDDRKDTKMAIRKVMKGEVEDI